MTRREAGFERQFQDVVVLTPEGPRRGDLAVKSGQIAALSLAPDAPAPEDIAGATILSPPLTDLQVNGGGGLMLGEAQDLSDLARIVAAHRASGVAQILPTLISDRPQEVLRIARLIEAARAAGMWQILGLHLEGPHIARAGAHDAGALRPMRAEDLDLYLELAARLGCLKLTLDPDLAAPEAIARLAQGGVIVALGHSNCSAETAARGFAAGARSATHLFNAMSGLDHRAPGLAAAALDHGCFGLIADGQHVHPAMLRLAARLGARSGAYLVSDAMAVAGTELSGFSLAGRAVKRDRGRLCLADGTLAGADLTLPQAVLVMAQRAGLPRDRAIAMATAAPRALIGLNRGLVLGDPALIQIWEPGGDAAPSLMCPD